MSNPVPLFDIDIVPLTGFWSPWVSTTGLAWEGGTGASIDLGTRFTGDAGGTYRVQVMHGNVLSEQILTNSGQINVILSGNTGVSYTGSVSVRVMNLSPFPLQQIEISAPNGGGFQLILPNPADQVILRNLAQSIGSDALEDVTLSEYEQRITSELDANGNGIPSLFEAYRAINQTGENYMANIIFNAMRQARENCFLAGTPIDMWPLDLSLQPGPDGVYDQAAVQAAIWTKPIEQVAPTDLVITFDDKGNMVPGFVDKLFTNTTAEFMRLALTDGRDPIVTTPGHRFLTETGDYMEIGHMLRLGGGTARVVDLDGSIIEVTGELLVYSAETAHMFPEAQTKTIAMQGNTVLKEQVEAGWQTFNFEVRKHHNYVAGGVRVHNDSILSLLQPEDELVALSDDLRDAIVLRNVDADPAKEIVLLDGYEATNGSTAIEKVINLSASGVTLGQLDLEATLATVAANNPLLASQPEALFALFEAAILLFPGQTVSSTSDVAAGGLTPIEGSNAGQSWNGTSAAEWYRGNGGNDAVIRGNNGDDILEGGDGNDNIRGGNGDDMVIGDAGNDKLYGDNGEDTINGGDGADKIYGNAGEDLLDGGAGNDRIEGGDHSDVIYGGSGDDIIYTGSGSANEYGIDFAYGGDGNDNLIGSNGGDNLYGEAGNDTLTGGQDYSSADRGYLYGGDGNDVISSGQIYTPNSSSQANGDTMHGEAGNDRIISGKANDVLNGGSGADTFVFDDQYGKDVIEDFNVSQSGERIDLSDVNAISGFTNFNGFKATYLSEVNGDAVISYDNNNQITLEGVSLASLSADDFIL